MRISLCSRLCPCFRIANEQSRNSVLCQPLVCSDCLCVPSRCHNPEKNAAKVPALSSQTRLRTAAKSREYDGSCQPIRFVIPALFAAGYTCRLRAPHPANKAFRPEIFSTASIKLVLLVRLTDRQDRDPHSKKGWPENILYRTAVLGLLPVERSAPCHIMLDHCRAAPPRQCADRSANRSLS